MLGLGAICFLGLCYISHFALSHCNHCTLDYANLPLAMSHRTLIAPVAYHACL